MTAKTHILSTSARKSGPEPLRFRAALLFRFPALSLYDGFGVGVGSGTGAERGSPSLDGFAEVFAEGRTWRVIGQTLAQATAGTALALALGPAGRSEPAVTFGSLVQEMADRDALAVFPAPRYESLQASSYNRLSTARDQPDQGTGGWFADSDGTGFIRTEVINGQTEWVVMEHSGPGALTRFWTPFFYYDFGNRSGPNIRIYLDGSTTPVIDQNFIELLTNLGWGPEYGAKPAPQNTLTVPAPFAGFTARAGVLHLPVPFASRGFGGDS